MEPTHPECPRASRIEHSDSPGARYRASLALISAGKFGFTESLRVTLLQDGVHLIDFWEPRALFWDARPTWESESVLQVRFRKYPRGDLSCVVRFNLMAKTYRHESVLEDAATHAELESVLSRRLQRIADDLG